MQKENIIYIYPSSSTFIKKDINFLSKKYNVKTPKFNWTNIYLTPFSFIKQFFFLCKYIYVSKVIFVMFGGYWSFLPSLFGKLFNKPVFIILGGTDCVSFPSINYGSLRKPLLRKFIKWSYQLSTRLLPVDESLVFCNYNYYEKREYNNQGYRFFFPKLTTGYTVINNGFDIEHFDVGDVEKDSNSFITIANIVDMRRFKIKGIDLLFQLANIYPLCTFTVIGISEKFKNELNNIPKNVNLNPFLPSTEFKKYLSKSEFYLQLSISEGFPNALCEAMLCKCVPIGSSVGAIPFIIDNTGYVIENSKFSILKNQFDKIINTSKTNRMELSIKARNRIIDKFHINKREKMFFEIINEYSNI